MKDDKMALNNIAGEDASDSTPPVEEPKATEEVLESPPEMAVEEKTETEDVPKKGAEARIRELVAKNKETEAVVQAERAKAESLAQKLAARTGSVEPIGGYEPPQYQPPPLPPLVVPGEEITADELERRMQQRDQRIIQQAAAMDELKDKQREAITRVNNEAEKVVRLYPQLDPDSDQFDEELSDAVYEAIDNGLKANPFSVSPLKISQKLMKPYFKAIDKEVGKEKENIAKQVSQAALRPTSIRKQEKPDAEKTIEELEQELGIAQY